MFVQFNNLVFKLNSFYVYEVVSACEIIECPLGIKYVIFFFEAFFNQLAKNYLSIRLKALREDCLNKQKELARKRKNGLYFLKCFNSFLNVDVTKMIKNYSQSSTGYTFENE